MAIKDLFSKQKAQSQQFRGANKKSVDEFKQDIESGEEIKQIRIEDSLVIPDLNYGDANNFVNTALPRNTTRMPLNAFILNTLMMGRIKRRLSLATA